MFSATRWSTWSIRTNLCGPYGQSQDKRPVTDILVTNRTRRVDVRSERTQNGPMDADDLAKRIDQAIGAELFAQRDKHRMSRATLASRSGVAPKTIQRFEEG